jgi:hypothetical protein
MPHKPWKEEETQLLRSLHEKRKKIVVEGRSAKSIRRKLVSLGLVKPAFTVKKEQTKKPWSNEEIELLKKGVNPPNRSLDSIRNMSVRLKLISNKKGARKKWTKKQEKILFGLVKQGKTAKEIFNSGLLPAHSKNSIQKKMCYVGLVNKRKVPFVKLSKDEVFILQKFLLENYKGKTPDDLVSIWNEKPYFKVNRSKVLYHLCILKIKIPYGEVAKINNLRKKEQSIINSPHRSQKELEESIRLARVEFMRQRFSEGRDIWTGVSNEEVNEDLEVEFAN